MRTMSTLCDFSETDKATLRRILGDIESPTAGLPDAVFDFALGIIPMVNVDLLISDTENRVLLAWREDRWGAGWHVPGGIIRIYESFSERITATAQLELGLIVRHKPAPISMTQFFVDRGHFISLLYECDIVGDQSVVIDESAVAAPHPNALGWFSKPPAAIYPAHAQYIPRLPQFGASNPLTTDEILIEER